MTAQRLTLSNELKLSMSISYWKFSINEWRRITVKHSKHSFVIQYYYYCVLLFGFITRNTTTCNTKVLETMSHSTLWMQSTEIELANQHQYLPTTCERIQHSIEIVRLLWCSMKCWQSIMMVRLSCVVANEAHSNDKKMWTQQLYMTVCSVILSSWICEM